MKLYGVKLHKSIGAAQNRSFFYAAAKSEDAPLKRGLIDRINSQALMNFYYSKMSKGVTFCDGMG